MFRFDHRSGQQLDVDGAKIYFEVHGHEDDPALVLLHGGLENIAGLNVIAERFTEPYRLIGIDSRGHGRSTLGPAALTYDRLQQDVLRVVKHLRLDRFGLIGFSDGGIVALRIAVAEPKRIHKLVAIGAPADPPGPKLRELYAGITADSWRRKFPGAYETYRALNPEPDFDALVPAVLPMWLDPSETGYPQDAVKNIACDLLAVRGDEDHLVSRDDVFTLVQRVAKSKLLNVPFASHVVHFDQAEVVMSSVNAFLRAR